MIGGSAKRRASKTLKSAVPAANLRFSLFSSACVCFLGAGFDDIGCVTTCCCCCARTSAAAAALFAMNVWKSSSVLLRVLP